MLELALLSLDALVSNTALSAGQNCSSESSRRAASSANWGQIIGINLFLPLLLAIIVNYWQLLAIIGIIFLRKVLLLLAIIGLHPKH